MRMTKADIFYQIVIYGFIGLLLLASLFPLVYVIGLSFTSETEWNQSGGKVVIPQTPSLEGYRMVLRQSNTFFRCFRFSVIRTTIGTVLTIFFTMCVGYVVSIQDIPFRKTMMLFVLITILFSGGLIPTFLVVSATGMYNTLWALIIPGLVNSWSVLVFKQFFQNIPSEIKESTRMDGAGEIRLMWVIIVPLSKAVLAALSLFAAVGHWNSWFDAAVFIKDESLQPLQLLLRNLFKNASVGFSLQQGGNLFNSESRMTPVSIRMAITVLGTLPILCVYPFLQKYFTKGVYTGSIKG